MECNISRTNFSRDKKPLKLLLEIILNRKKMTFDAPIPVQIPDLNTTNSSNNTLEGSIDVSLSPSKRIKKKRKTIEIKIKLDISDASQDGYENAEFQSTMKRISSKISVCTKDDENVTSLRKMASKISLAIKDSNKEIENHEETIFFDLFKEQSDNVTTLTDSQLDTSHNHSFWHKIFQKIQNSYQSSQDDGKVIEIIHELIREKYNQALNIIKQRIEKRERKNNESKKSYKDFKIGRQRTSLHHRNSTLLDISNDLMETEIIKTTRSLLDISNDEILNPDNILTPTKSINKEKDASDDLIMFETDKNSQISYDLKKERVASFLKSEGYNMYNDISKILKPDTRLSNNFEEDIVEYDSKQFLSAALGNDMDSSYGSQSDYQTCLYDTPTIETPDTFTSDKSIDSSHISCLISESGQRKSAGIYSLYSSVMKKTKKYRNQEKTMAKSTKSSYNDYGYESLDDLDFSHLEKKLMKDNVRQNEIIHQISKAVSICRNYPGSFEPNVIAEAEKILLVANLRKDVIDDELKKIEYEEIDHQLASSSVIIRNLEIFCKPNSLAKHKHYDWYYVCAVRHGSTVNVTKLLKQEDTAILFPDKFNFVGVPSDFEIEVSVYGLMRKNKKQKKNKPKSRNDLKTIPPSSSISTQSYFVLWGTTIFKPSQLNQGEFNLQVLPEAPILGVLNANIETTFRIHVKKEGFLTIGVDFKGHPIWNRRWCSLNGSKLSYWNYANEEEHCEPLGELDLLNCVFHEVQRAERDICPSPRTLFILMKGEENGESVQRRYFLAADNSSDFESWKESLNLVLNYLRKWSNFNCYLDN